MQEWWSKDCTHSLTKGKTLTQGHPEDRTAHPKGAGLTQGYSEELITHWKRVRAHNLVKFWWVMSQTMGRVTNHRPAALWRTLSEGLWHSLVGSELWSFMVCGPEVSAEARHWLGSCLLTKGSRLSLSHHRGQYVTRVKVSQQGHGCPHWTRGVYATMQWQTARHVKIWA